MIVTKRSTVLLLGIMVILVMVGLPSAVAVDEYRYVDAYSDVDWDETGSDPYMDAQDQPTNIISQNSNGALTGWCSFADTSGTGTGFTVVFSVYHDSVNDAYIEWELDWTSDGTAEASGSFSTAHAYAWEDDSVDLSALDTQAEIDQCRVRFTVNKGGGGPNLLSIDAARLYITGGSGGGTDYTAYPDGDLTLTGSTSLIADFVKTLADGFALAGTTSLFGAFAKILIEGFTLAGTTSIFVIIQKIIVEGFTLTGGTSLIANFSVLLASGFALAGATSLIASFSVRLSVGFTLGGAVSAAVSYVKTLIEGFSLGGTISAFKVLIVNLADSFSFGVGVDILKIVGVSLIGSMFFQLFFNLSMWGYLGPIGLVIVGYVLTNKEKVLGILFFVVESLVIANYLTLVSATPDYWWHVFILLIGCISTLMYSVLGDK